MPTRTPPPLALALAAAASCRLHLEEHEGTFGEGFMPAVAAMDAADRAYRASIEATLPRAPARAILTEMAAFRERVHRIRERACRDIDELYRRGGRSYGAFDPLDTFMPPTAGLNHADGMRVATFADAARSEVDALRAHVNGAVTERLQPAQIDVLIAAKRDRRAAFEAVLRGALDAVVAPHATMTGAQIDKAAYHLTSLADGWY